MPETIKDPAKNFFDDEVSDRDRAIFEGGITLGSLYHQFAGTPVGNRETMEKNITESALAHPFIVNADVEIKGESERRSSPYDYTELHGGILKIDITARYNSCEVDMKMELIPKLDYPLMYIAEIRE